MENGERKEKREKKDNTKEKWKTTTAHKHTWDGTNGNRLRTAVPLNRMNEKSNPKHDVQIARMA